MLEKLHELLGGAAVATLIAVAALGAALYFYPRVRGWLPLPRPRLVLLHRWGAAGFLGLAAAHYLLAPQVHPLQPLGALGLVAAFVLGWRLRRNKQHYQLLIQAKTVLVLVGAVALFAGHALLEEAHDREEYGGSGSGVEWSVAFQDCCEMSGVELPPPL